MKTIFLTLAFLLPALLLSGAELDRASLAEQYISIQEAHHTGRVSYDWPSVRPGVVKYVAGIFTEDELRGILAFYKSPAGQAFLTKEPKIQLRTTLQSFQLAQDASRQAKDAPPPNSLESATRLLDEMRRVHGATEQWAIENDKRKGEIPTPGDVLVYLRVGSRMRTALESGRCVDALGNPLKLAPFGTPPTISHLTVDQLSAVVPRDFWKPFQIE